MIDVVKTNATYVTGVTRAQLDSLRATVNCWAEGEETLCMDFENACHFRWLRHILLDAGVEHGDVIVSL